MGYLIGIDVGTSATKALLIDERGSIITSASEEYPVYNPQPGWSEQYPDDWWKATVNTIRRLVDDSKISPKEIKGIGLSGQMHGSVFLDANNAVLRPAILWNDQRTAAECDEITSMVGRERLLSIVCNPALTGFTAPKILWVRKHEPDVYEKAKKILLPKDYIRFRLTGEFATEVSDASGTLLLNIQQRDWASDILSDLQIDISLLPECYESHEVTGKVTPDVAEYIGIPAGIPVVGGGGDQAAGAVGNGIVRTGTISVTMGTSGVVFAFSDEVHKDPLGRVHTFCHAVENKWHVMGVVLAAGGSLQWYRNNLSRVEQALARKRSVDPYDVLCEEAAEAPAGCEGLLFLPYLTGERTPHADPYAKGAWVGLTMRHTKNELIRSVMEGATYAMRDSLEIIKNMNIPINQIRVSGGGARSELWRQMQADIYGYPVSTINATEGPAYGVALLAGVGTGVYKNIQEACDLTITTVATTDVDPDNTKMYNAFYPLYRKLYQSLKGDFREIAKVVAEM